MNAATEKVLSTDLQELTVKLTASAGQTDKEARFPAQNLKVLADAGLLGLLIPTNYGGCQADAETFRRLTQAIGAGCASTGMIFVMHCTAVETIAKYHKTKDKLLEQAAEGKHLSTLACSERGTGANFYASSSTSQKSDANFVLNGDKCFVTSGGHADSYVVSTRAPGSDDCINTSIYVVERESSGLSFHGDWQGLGLRGNSSISLKLTDCAVPEENLLGEAGAGLQIEMSSILPRFLLGSASVYNGITEAAFNATINHVKSRVHAHTSESISMLPVLRNKIAQMKVAFDSSAALTKTAAEKFESREADALIVLLEAKQLACASSVQVANMAMDACGGIAYSSALSIERHLRDARAGVVMAPTNDMALDLIGRAALGLPLM